MPDSAQFCTSCGRRVGRAGNLVPVIVGVGVVLVIAGAVAYVFVGPVYREVLRLFGGMIVVLGLVLLNAYLNSPPSGIEGRIRIEDAEVYPPAAQQGSLSPGKACSGLPIDPGGRFILAPGEALGQWRGGRVVRRLIYSLLLVGLGALIWSAGRAAHSSGAYAAAVVAMAAGGYPLWRMKRSLERWPRVVCTPRGLVLPPGPGGKGELFVPYVAFQAMDISLQTKTGGWVEQATLTFTGADVNVSIDTRDFSRAQVEQVYATVGKIRDCVISRLAAGKQPLSSEKDVRQS